MNKKNDSKKLKLKRETVRTLSTTEMQGVAGGSLPPSANMGTVCKCNHRPVMQ